jgi:hypothetical protein
MYSKEFTLIMKVLKKLNDKIDSLKNGIPEEVLLDSIQMQQLLHCSPSTLQRLRKKGTLPCNQVGRRYYYPKSYFTQEFLNSIIKVEDPSKAFDDK